jgi:hypothetical protein
VGVDELFEEIKKIIEEAEPGVEVVEHMPPEGKGEEKPETPIQMKDALPSLLFSLVLHR